jgi:hypothetical protein
MKGILFYIFFINSLAPRGHVVRREAEIHHLLSPMIGHENEIRWLRGVRSAASGSNGWASG